MTGITLHEFNIFLLIMSGIAAVVFVALYFLKAGYGMFSDSRWGISLNNKVAWVLMEAPVFIVMALLWWESERRFETAPLIIFLLFELHYFQRSFVFPFLMKGKSRMPVSIMLMGVVFNVLNGFMQGEWLFYLAPADRYTPDWLLTPQFIIGTLIFLFGMVVNIQSDYIIRHLRRPGETVHRIPYGGMFRYVSSANYFGEFVEWVGFAVLTWSWSGAVFALWTFANLAPRAVALHKRYETEFGESFTRLHRKCILPFIF